MLKNVYDSVIDFAHNNSIYMHYDCLEICTFGFSASVTQW